MYVYERVCWKWSNVYRYYIAQSLEYDCVGMTDGRYMTDIDECLNGTHTCDSGAECVNTEGSFLCNCPVGYQSNGESCEGTIT